MINHSTPSGSPGKVEVFTWCQGVELLPHIGYFLAEAEGDGGAVPVVMPKPRVRWCRVALQQKKVGRHIFGRTCRAFGKKIELHGFKNRSRSLNPTRFSTNGGAALHLRVVGQEREDE
jgi:hypothetical protein